MLHTNSSKLEFPSVNMDMKTKQASVTKRRTNRAIRATRPGLLDQPGMFNNKRGGPMRPGGEGMQRGISYIS